VSTGSRHQAREAALQILYQSEVGGTGADEAIQRHWSIEQEAPELPRQARAFAEQLVHGTLAHAADIDPVISRSAQHWRLERMAIIDRLILRLAVFEFLHCPETPHSVVIDEAIELARTFGEHDAVRFVNGVLDGVHHALAGDAPAGDTPTDPDPAGPAPGDSE
jgi:N utilization substance protein B